MTQNYGKTYLVHHGILGQKWGKRNGPPYPLDESDKSSVEKKHEDSNKNKNNNKSFNVKTTNTSDIEKKIKTEKIGKNTEILIYKGNKFDYTDISDELDKSAFAKDISFLEKQMNEKHYDQMCKILSEEIKKSYKEDVSVQKIKSLIGKPTIYKYSDKTFELSVEAETIGYFGDHSLDFDLIVKDGKAYLSKYFSMNG